AGNAFLLHLGQGLATLLLTAFAEVGWLVAVLVLLLLDDRLVGTLGGAGVNVRLVGAAVLLDFFLGDRLGIGRGREQANHGRSSNNCNDLRGRHDVSTPQWITPLVRTPVFQAPRTCHRPMPKT